ncbi:MAG: glutathione peroxidase [Planctomycetes bacterium]|nr:glutathione peroxidase [Planctomycetota bacterium]
MRIGTAACLAAVLAWTAGARAEEGKTAEEPGKKEEQAVAKSVHEFTLKANDGTDQKLAGYKGKVVLLVNVASRCGYTPQYTQLEAVYRKYKDQGLVVVGIPCNDFGAQEPGTDAQIKEFCTKKFDVTFPLMSKVHVQGDECAPLYKYLTETSSKPGKIKWNFEKFLIGKNGAVIERYASGVKPDAENLTKAIEEALKAE